MLRIALLLGGPSEERGISLNSARSVADHISGDGVEIHEIIYFDQHTRPFAISRSLLYSNTPSDFDFKLSREGRSLPDADLLDRLQACDLALPVMHGVFGEDGGVQALLERAGVPYLGSPPAASARAFDKFDAHRALTDAGIAPVPSRLVTARTSIDQRKEYLAEAMRAGTAVVKPAQAGSSIGVHVIADVHTGLEVLDDLVARHGRVVVQPRMTGVEFTTIVLSGGDGPVALVPVEIELRGAGSDIFDYRRKYLVSNDSHYHCPPRFPDETIDRIRRTSEQTFSLLGLRDFARIDGWLDADGSISISDVNPISGMEQNSFLFLSAAQIGMTHRDILRFLVRAVCVRAGIDAPVAAWRMPPPADRRDVAVLFGGDTAERQVSVLSGTNVWLKLLGSGRFHPIPHLLDKDGSVWRLPYAAALRHSAEEIAEVCRDAAADDGRLARLAGEITKRLDLEYWQAAAGSAPPVHLTMDEFLTGTDLVFNALHGGAGENGTLAREFDRRGIRYNGSGPDALALCADKYETGVAVASMADNGIQTARRAVVAMPAAMADVDPAALWRTVVGTCGTEKIIVKPLDDGCSAGVVPLAGPGELRLYLGSTLDGAARISGGAFSLLSPQQIVELPTKCPSTLLFEEFVSTDDIAVVDAADDGGEPAHLAWGVERDTGWVEVTVGVLGHAGAMRALSPSVTIARKGVLSLEEKFMGGTGVNLTPVPGPPLGRAAPEAVERARASVARVADRLGMAGYGRIDAFLQRDTGEVIIIEANALPGLTPATVLYHQGLAETPPLPPRALLEYILDLALTE